MKLDRLDVHDRFEHFTKQSFDIGQNCQDIIDKRPFGDHPFYIFAHKRTIELDEKISLYNQDLQNSLVMGCGRKYFTLSDVPSARIIWQPRLTKPKAQSNSMLFKVSPNSDNVKVVWMIPAEELWEQYEKNKITQNKLICESIYAFKTDKARLEAKEPDDLDDKEIDAIYEDIALSAKRPQFNKII